MSDMLVRVSRAMNVFATEVPTFQEALELCYLCGVIKLPKVLCLLRKIFPR